MGDERQLPYEYEPTHAELEAEEAEWPWTRRLRSKRDEISQAVAHSWPHTAAEAYSMLAMCRAPLAAAFKNHNPCYAASTYAMFDALSQAAEMQVQRPLDSISQVT